MARSLVPWLKLRKKTDPELPVEPPIFLGDRSNGEFFHHQTPLERRIRKVILEKADEKARYLGVDRREFLASAMGMATSLGVLNLAAGCGGEDGTVKDGEPADGGYAIPPEATVDCDVATEVLGGDEFIFDLQTHHLIDEELWRERRGPDRPFPNNVISFVPDCGTIDCIDQHAYAREIFAESDTTVAVLSGIPSRMCETEDLCTGQLSNEDMVLTREWINQAAGSQRVVQHCQVAPNDDWERQSRMMERVRTELGNHGWKCYPPWGPERGPGGTLAGWRLDDEVGTRFIDRCLELGEPLICIHKGFVFPGWNPDGADPSDVGPTALRYPEAKLVIYHSAYDVSSPGVGAYNEDNPRGVDRLVKTVVDHGLRGKNVYAEMGSAWALVMNSPRSAQHYVGKMLKYLGEDNLLWGSECTWFGSPQPQIEAFRQLSISREFQEQYGYPELTPEVKRKILGLNAAKLYGIDPDEVRCHVNVDRLAALRKALDAELGGRRWALQQPRGPRTRREFLQLGRLRQARREPG